MENTPPTRASLCRSACQPQSSGRSCVIGFECTSRPEWADAFSTAEPAYLAKHAFQLAQEFNNFYHRHHVLNEADAARKTFLLATAAVAEREMVRALGLLGIEAPEVM